MNQFRYITKLEYKRDNCFFFLSANNAVPNDPGSIVVPRVSAVYYNLTHAGEWCMEANPIRVWIERGKDDEDAIPHYVFPFVKDDKLNWAQGAVNTYALPDAAKSGDWGYIFDVLKVFARSYPHD